MNRSRGGGAVFGPKLSILTGDPDYRGVTTFIYIHTWSRLHRRCFLLALICCFEQNISSPPRKRLTSSLKKYWLILCYNKFVLLFWTCFSVNIWNFGCNYSEVFILFLIAGGTACIYRVSQEEWTKFRESVPYVKIYRYNPEHLYPKLNGYGDNGQRKVWSSLGFHSLYLTADSVIGVEALSVVSYYADSSHDSCTLHMYFLQGDVSAEQSCVMYSVWNPKDNYDMSASVFVVQFNGFMSLTR
jgi:hypothetical protein